jgi:hypothetical protein
MWRSQAWTLVTSSMTIALPGQTHGWLPIILVLVGLALVAGMAGLLAFRPQRRGGPRRIPDRRR